MAGEKTRKLRVLNGRKGLMCKDSYRWKDIIVKKKKPWGLFCKTAAVD
jgi:hypothetical protein